MRARKCIKCDRIFGCIRNHSAFDCAWCEVNCSFICVDDVSGGLCAGCLLSLLQVKKEKQARKGSNP